MAFLDLLDHRCSIYHIKKNIKSLGYGIDTMEFKYPDKPDIENIPCHFNVGDNGSFEQNEPVNEYIVVGKLQLPAGTDVRINDKIEDISTGITYKAELPKNIRDHHIIVNVQRKGTVKGAL